MKIHKWLLAAIVAVLCLTGCSMSTEQQPPSSPNIKFLTDDQAEIVAGQHLELMTSLSFTGLSIAFDNKHNTNVTEWNLASLPGKHPFFTPSKVDVTLSNIGDKDSLYDNSDIIITRVRDDAITVSWSPRFTSVVPAVDTSFQ